MTEKRSPIREKPLHLPGQSLDEEIQRLRQEDIFTYFLYAAGFAAFAIAEWIRWLTSAKYQPVLMTFVALLVIGYCTFQINRIRKRIRALELGRDGERIVAEILDDLREKGFSVLHDIVARNFNIDHVVISPHGIFAIETKTLMKPPRGEVKIVGKNLIAGEYNLGEAPIEQVQSEAKWLKSRVAESTGKQFPVKPVLVFPDWFVKPMPEYIHNEVWILNPKALLSFIPNESKMIQDSDMHLITFHLTRFIRLYGS